MALSPHCRFQYLFNCSLISWFFCFKLFQEYHSSRVSNKLNPDQARHFVGSDLGPNCLQRLLTSRERDAISGQCSLDTEFKVFLTFQPFLDKKSANGYTESVVVDSYEPWHEISNNVVCVTSKASDQPAHTHSLIRAFASRLNILWVLSYWLNIIWSF